MQRIMAIFSLPRVLARFRSLGVNFNIAILFRDPEIDFWGARRNRRVGFLFQTGGLYPNFSPKGASELVGAMVFPTCRMQEKEFGEGGELNSMLVPFYVWGHNTRLELASST